MTLPKRTVLSYFLRAKVRSRKQIFSYIYEHRLWRANGTLSGAGSTLENTVDVRQALPAMLSSLGVTSILDAPCGDFHWMREVVSSGRIQNYLGVDIVPDLIEENNRRYGSQVCRFMEFDVVNTVPPSATLIICRHLLIHLSLRDSLAVIENFKKSGARYLLITSNPTVHKNREILFTGWYKDRNLELTPFALGPKLGSIKDGQNQSDPTELVLFQLNS